MAAGERTLQGGGERVSEPLNDTVSGLASDLPADIGQWLNAERATLATAESCTGGAIASLLTQVTGASEWYQGGVVAYTYGAKSGILGVAPVDLSDGLVTERCAKAMAAQAAAELGVSYAIATTGVCGPSSSEGVAPCTAWVGLYIEGECQARRFHCADRGRSNNIAWVAQQALSYFWATAREESVLR